MLKQPNGDFPANKEGELAGPSSVIASILVIKDNLENSIVDKLGSSVEG